VTRQGCARPAEPDDVQCLPGEPPRSAPAPMYRMAGARISAPSRHPLHVACKFAAGRLAPERTPLRGNPAIPRTTRARLPRLPPEIKDGAASGLAASLLGGRFPLTADRHGTEGAVNQQAMPGATGRELKSVPVALASNTGGESHSGSVVSDLEIVTETQLGPNSVCLHVRAEGPC